MATRKSSIREAKAPTDKTEKNTDGLPDIALAAIASFKKQKEIGDFMDFLLGALERNSIWLNSAIDKRTKFRCGFMVGAGPNRFQLQEMIYPSKDEDIKLEVELKESEDHDKIAVAALLKLSNLDMKNVQKYIKTQLINNLVLKEDLLKGKALGIIYAILTPISEKQYRIAERIVIDTRNSVQSVNTSKKRCRENKLVIGPPKKTKRLF